MRAWQILKRPFLRLSHETIQLLSMRPRSSWFFAQTTSQLRIDLAYKYRTTVLFHFGKLESNFLVRTNGHYHLALDHTLWKPKNETEKVESIQFTFHRCQLTIYDIWIHFSDGFDDGPHFRQERIFADVTGEQMWIRIQQTIHLQATEHDICWMKIVWVLGPKFFQLKRHKIKNCTEF